MEHCIQGDKLSNPAVTLEKTVVEDHKTTKIIAKMVCNEFQP